MLHQLMIRNNREKFLKRLSLFAFLAFGLSLVPQKAQGEVLLEPSVGLVSVSAKGSYKGSSISTSGVGLDAGLIFAKSERDWFAGLVGNLYYVSYSNSNVAGEMGYTLGFGIGGTLTYIPLRFYGSADMVAGGDGMMGAVSPGLRMGVTYYFTPLMALNIESKTVSAEAASSDILTSMSFLNITLSMPMELQYPTTPWRERTSY